MKFPRKPFYNGPSNELTQAFERIKNPQTPEDIQLATATSKLQQALQRSWANRQKEITHWEKKHPSRQVRKLSQ